MNEKLIEALKALDVTKAGDWNEDGKPNLARVRALSQNEKLSRQDIEAVAAGFVRDNSTSFFNQSDTEAEQVNPAPEAEVPTLDIDAQLEALGDQLQEKSLAAAQLQREREAILKEREALLASKNVSHQDHFYTASRLRQEAIKREEAEKVKAYHALKAQGLDIQALSALGSASPLDLAMARNSNQGL